MYRFAFAKLGLRPNAVADLVRRELSLEAIERHGFKSLPQRGAEHVNFIRRMREQFSDDLLRRVPGFFDKNGRLGFRTASATRDGYVVPYVDELGRITGFQVRQLGTFSGAKYLTPYGARLDGVYIIAGAAEAGCTIYLTEGGLKAIVAHELGGYVVFAVAGQSLSGAHVDVLLRLSPAKVVVALDREANPNTERARVKWLKTLKHAGLNAVEAIWEGDDVGGAKGLDDLLHTVGAPRERLRAFPPSEMGERRTVVDTVEPGFIHTGITLRTARAQLAEEIEAFLKGSRRTPRGRLIRATPGVGKTKTVANALARTGTAARIVVGTSDLAAEMAAEHGYYQVHGRNSDNCDRHDVVVALGEAGHEVEQAACGTPSEPRCPFRRECMYYRQFDRLGTWVGTTEQLFNARFLKAKAPVVVDDGELARSLIARGRVSREALARVTHQLHGAQHSAVLELVRILEHAITDVPSYAGQLGSIFGSNAWDHLARTARRYDRSIIELIGLIDNRVSLPSPAVDESGWVTAATVAEVPPRHLRTLIAVLKREAADFAWGDEFNSRLRIGPDGIDVWQLRDPILDGDEEAILAQRPVLVLDATPIEPLVDHLLAMHHRLPDLDITVPIPDSVTVVQYATSTGGHTVLRDDGRRARTFAEVAAERELYPVSDPTREGIVLFKEHRHEAVAAGFQESQVVTFGNARGTNALRNAERLHVVGRPMPPSDELLYLAQVIHHDGPPLMPDLVLTRRSFGGQRKAIDVVDFADPRAAVLLRAFRDDEILQVVYRARPADLPNAPGLWDEEGKRQRLRIVIHGSHPVAGLRIDELHLTAFARDLNHQREQEAEARVLAAAERIRGRGEALSISAVAREARAARETVAKALGTPEDTLKRDLHKGPVTLPKLPASESSTGGELAVRTTSWPVRAVTNTSCALCGGVTTDQEQRVCEGCGTPWQTLTGS